MLRGRHITLLPVRKILLLRHDSTLL